jgi:hypothetical protein
MDKGILKNPLFQNTEIQQTSKMLTRQASKTVKQPLIKCTYYLPENTVEEIEKIRYTLITKYKTKISKSKIVEKAINLANKDLELNKDKGLFKK